MTLPFAHQTWFDVYGSHAHLRPAVSALLPPGLGLARRLVPAAAEATA